MRLLPASAFVALLTAAALGLGAPEPVELELLYLANEGFLLRSGETSVLIDAFVAEPYGPYAAVPEELRRKILAGEGPFADVDLALTSHRHRDHFQAEVAAEFVRARPAVPFLSSPQVVDDLRASLDDPELSGRLDARVPGAGESVRLEANGVTVELLRLPHSGGARTADVQNLGHLLTVGGARILHVGDAELGEEALERYALGTRAIDLALVPYWWLVDAESLARVHARTGAKHLVAMHVPPEEVAEVRARLARLDPALGLLEKPGASRTWKLERPG